MEKPKQHDIFSLVYDIANELLTRLSRHSVKWMNGKACTILNPRSFEGFFWIVTAKSLKNPYLLKTVTFKLSQKGKKTKRRKAGGKQRLQINIFEDVCHVNFNIF